MKDRALIATGAVGVVLAAICCAAPLLAVTLATAGLTAWLANGAYVLIPALLVCLALVATGSIVGAPRQIAARPRRTTRKSSHEQSLRAPAKSKGLRSRRRSMTSPKPFSHI
jgi:mercuric ion transport protein